MTVISSRIGNNLPEDPLKSNKKTLRRSIDKRKLHKMFSETSEKAVETKINDEDLKIYASKRLNSPNINEDLFGEFEPTSSGFWEKFTNTSAKSFEESVKLGVWKTGGAWNRRLIIKEEKPISRDEKHLIARSSFPCPMISASNTQLVCNIANIPAAQYSLSLSVAGTGSAVISNSVSAVSISSSITSISPAIGSVHGGALLSITGLNFAVTGTTVKIDGNDCLIEDATITMLKCRTPSHPAGTASVVVNSGGSDISSPTDYTYSLANTPSITSVS